MSGDRLIDLLTEIRDQQKQQIENFERALQGQDEYMALQRKSRKAFVFLVYAPWGALVLTLAYMFISAEIWK